MSQVGKTSEDLSHREVPAYRFTSGFDRAWQTWDNIQAARPGGTANITATLEAEAGRLKSAQMTEVGQDKIMQNNFITRGGNHGMDKWWGRANIGVTG